MFPRKSTKKKKRSGLSRLLHVQRPMRYRKPQKAKRKLQPFKHFKARIHKKVSDYINPQFLVGIVAVTLFGIVIGIVFFTNFFVVSDILVVRDTVHADVEMVEQKLADQKGKNILLIFTGSLEKELLQEFPNYQDITIKKLFPHSLQVVLHSYPIFARIKIQGTKREYFLNSNGVVVADQEGSEAGEALSDLLLVEIPLYADIYEKNKEIVSSFIELQPGKRFFSEELFKTIRNILALYEKNFSQSVSTMTYLPIEEELHLTLLSGTEILLALDKSIEVQLYKLKVDEANVPIADGSIAYVDLRIKDKVIFCRVGKQCSR